MSEGVPVAVLAAFGLEGATVAQFERGLINRHWLASAGGTRTVLRRYNTMRTREAITWEQSLVAHVAEAGWPVAPALPSLSRQSLLECEGQFWSAHRFLDGASNQAPTAEEFRLQGQLIAGLHADLMSFRERGQRPGFGCATDFDSVVRQVGTRTLPELEQALSLRELELAAEFGHRREMVLAELAAGGYSGLAEQPIHADFEDFNLLWQGGVLTGLLDFDFSRRDAAICDLAVMLVPFMPLDAARAAAVVAGYESVRPLTVQERSLICPLAKADLLRWVTFLLGTWAGEGELPAGVRRTLMVRLPAVEAIEDDWMTAWGAG